MTPATVDMEALIGWALSQAPPACEEGVKRARRGWDHLTSGDRQWIVGRCGPALHELLAQDPDHEVRWAVAWRCGPELQELLSQDPRWMVRWAVAQRCGPELLEVLTKDPHDWVRRTAAERLKDVTS